MKKIALILILFIIGCDQKEAVQTSITNNPQMKVDLLFENDGCKVYRFEDNNRNHYYANCAPGIFGTTKESFGKTSRLVDDTVQTTKS